MPSCTYYTRSGSGKAGDRGPHSKVCPTPVAPKRSVIIVTKWLHCAMFVLVTSLCLAFSGADIEFDLDLVLMTSACSQYLKA